MLRGEVIRGVPEKVSRGGYERRSENEKKKKVARRGSEKRPQTQATYKETLSAPSPTDEGLSAAWSEVPAR